MSSDFRAEEGNRGFPTTEWSMILAARDTGASGSGEALAVLCQRYWGPVYTFIRYSGNDPDTAKDLTQGFFTQLLEKKRFKVADPDRGRFRSFLMASARHYLSDQWDRRRAIKRGGEKTMVSLDRSDTCTPVIQAVEEKTPETLFIQRWAEVTLQEVLTRLEQEELEKSTASEFEYFKAFLTGQNQRGNYEDLARELQMSYGAFKVRVHRLRRRFVALLREHISQTLADPREVDDEIRFLVKVLSS